MENHVEVSVECRDEEQRSILIVQLAEMGYDGFEESDEILKAYIPEESFTENDINILFTQYEIKYSKSIINKQNWNQLWESNFEPVTVDSFVGIRAAFHPSFDNVEHEIVITPKMSFGTGHHATTWQVMKLMDEMDFVGKSVLDFGTGTGILAILAEKLGAVAVKAVDNDDWCIENASENISINRCNNIDIEKVETAESAATFDIIIANINRNIILDNIAYINNSLTPGGELILSGLLVSDEIDILSACGSYGMVHAKTIDKNGWIAIRLFKKA